MYGSRRFGGTGKRGRRPFAEDAGPRRNENAAPSILLPLLNVRKIEPFLFFAVRRVHATFNQEALPKLAVGLFLITFEDVNLNCRSMEDIVNRRCGWAGTDDLYVKYHDEEWGRLVTDDRTLFEFLVLESAQAGLSWITILRKREGYKEAFHNFDFEKAVSYTHLTLPTKA